MNDKRQKIQLKLAFAEDARSEARSAFVEGTESFKAERKTESPAIVERLMEEVCERTNCEQALKRVQSNKGSAGVDGMTVQQLPACLKQHWPNIREHTNRNQSCEWRLRNQMEGCASSGSRRWWTDSSSRRFCRFCSNAGTRLFPITATVFDRGDRRIRP